MMAAPTGSAADPRCGLCHEARWQVWAHPYWSLYLNDNQNLLGKVMLVLNRHCESVPELTPEEWMQLRVEVHDAELALDRLFRPDHFNLMFLMNLDRHVHLHVVPRYRTARTYAGEDFADRDYGSLATTAARRMTDEWLNGLVGDLRDALERPER
jgi:diadenosine tetraphosphate (Ap4A) HIT family hydrolase